MNHKDCRPLLSSLQPFAEEVITSLPKAKKWIDLKVATVYLLFKERPNGKILVYRFYLFNFEENGQLWEREKGIL